VPLSGSARRSPESNRTIHQRTSMPPCESSGGFSRGLTCCSICGMPTYATLIFAACQSTGFCWRVRTWKAPGCPRTPNGLADRQFGLGDTCHSSFLPMYAMTNFCAVGSKRKWIRPAPGVKRACRSKTRVIPSLSMKRHTAFRCTWQARRPMGGTPAPLPRPGREIPPTRHSGTYLEDARAVLSVWGVPGGAAVARRRSGAGAS
jgi:hypothetical protein